MNLKKESYQISREVLEFVLKTLDENRFVMPGDGEEDNNDEVIEAHTLLTREIESQE